MTKSGETHCRNKHTIELLSSLSIIILFYREYMYLITFKFGYIYIYILNSHKNSIYKELAITWKILYPNIRNHGEQKYIEALEIKSFQEDYERLHWENDFI